MTSSSGIFATKPGMDGIAEHAGNVGISIFGSTTSSTGAGASSICDSTASTGEITGEDTATYLSTLLFSFCSS